MKNIHILPTDKPSRLIFNWEKDLCYKSKPYLMEGTQKIYITSDEEIKVGDWCIHSELQDLYFKDNNSIEYPEFKKYYKKIILTTDTSLDGVQKIDDEFLEWLVKNPSCEKVEISSNWHMFSNKDAIKNYGIIIPKEEPKQETLEEVAEIDLTNLCYYDKRNPDCSLDDEDIEGHKKSLLKKNKTCSCDNCFYGRSKLTEQLILQAKRMYNEEDLKEAFKGGGRMSWTDINQETQEPYYYDFNEWFEQFKKK